MALQMTNRRRTDGLRSAVVCSAIALLAVSRIRNDPQLLAALNRDRELQALCSCVRGAAWVDESYPRITVDGKRWRSLGKPARDRFGARALRTVQAVYLEEWGTTHFYDQVFIVDQGGRQLFVYIP
jgi:hypothetical protein